MSTGRELWIKKRRGCVLKMQTTPIHNWLVVNNVNCEIRRYVNGCIFTIGSERVRFERVSAQSRPFRSQGAFLYAQRNKKSHCLHPTTSLPHTTSTYEALHMTQHSWLISTSLSQFYLPCLLKIYFYFHIKPPFGQIKYSYLIFIYTYFQKTTITVKMEPFEYCIDIF